MFIWVVFFYYVCASLKQWSWDPGFYKGLNPTVEKKKTLSDLPVSCSSLSDCILRKIYAYTCLCVYTWRSSAFLICESTVITNSKSREQNV